MKSIFFSLLIFACSVWAQDFSEPIDIVYLWVNGSDPDWCAIKEQHLLEEPDQIRKIEECHTVNRFSDNDELKYSLRSLWMYAPFINHIYIVTMNQRPIWLAPHPKITFIDHSEI